MEVLDEERESRSKKGKVMGFKEFVVKVQLIIYRTSCEL